MARTLILAFLLTLATAGVVCAAENPVAPGTQATPEKPAPLAPGAGDAANPLSGAEAVPSAASSATPDCTAVLDWLDAERSTPGILLLLAQEAAVPCQSVATPSRR